MVVPVRVRVMGVGRSNATLVAHTLDATESGVKLGGLRGDLNVGDVIEIQHRRERAMYKDKGATEEDHNHQSAVIVVCKTNWDIETRIRVEGRRLCRSGQWTYTMKRPEGDFHTRSRRTSMWTRYPSGWKRHVSQNTYINPQANQCALDAASHKSTSSQTHLSESQWAGSGLVLQRVLYHELIRMDRKSSEKHQLTGMT
jgi:hypothetical protein